MRILMTAAVGVFLFSTSVLGQELPYYVSLSPGPYPHATVAEAFRLVKSESNDYHLGKSEAAVYIKNREGAFTAYWKFSGGDVEAKPTRYVRFVVVNDDPYHVEVSLACEDGVEECRQFAADLPNSLPPPPPPTPPRRSDT